MFKRWFELLKQSFQEFTKDKCPMMGAALAFYTISALVPLILVVTSIATYILVATGYGRDFVGDIINYIGTSVSQQFAQQLQTVIENRQAELTKGSIISTIVGFVTLLFTASGVFGQLDASFDEIWNVPEEDKPKGIWGTVQAKMLSFGLVLGVAFLLLVSLLLTQLVTRFTSLIDDYLPFGGWLLPIANVVLQVFIVWLVFALLFKVLPSTHVEWRDVYLGALLTMVLWFIGQYLLSLYFRFSSFSAYGVIGGVLAFLAYVYYSSQIVFFGGEFTSVYAHTHGSRADESKRKEGLTPAGVVLAQSVGASRQREIDRARAEAEAARGQRVMAAATGGVVGVLGAAVLTAVAIVAGVARGVGRLRRG